ncbi:hypothetical protein P153DRAFT_361637 [Dothidotthia symphoricarpi CBS 119687]|uniref:Uncharacterized protein n=1 Tax=Dothidotthia symphoricarpi CBS 119687 TaxID=1392245 RepID=A0A6A5ZXL5_9PLEO|nr:uncharacterized protein P153DRAFT_361637 [Dothidotthia symphoricarpi CBS 119687]KAF2124016.1 hypothetical protein P153DRAFT_361637 [Dothidotthia symphoricarpi CBS 119687]
MTCRVRTHAALEALTSALVGESHGRDRIHTLADRMWEKTREIAAADLDTTGKVPCETGQHEVESRKKAKKSEEGSCTSPGYHVPHCGWPLGHGSSRRRRGNFILQPSEVYGLRTDILHLNFLRPTNRGLTSLLAGEGHEGKAYKVQESRVCFGVVEKIAGQQRVARRTGKGQPARRQKEVSVLPDTWNLPYKKLSPRIAYHFDGRLDLCVNVKGDEVDCERTGHNLFRTFVAAVIARRREVALELESSPPRPTRLQRSLGQRTRKPKLAQLHLMEARDTDRGRSAAAVVQTRQAAARSGGQPSL